MLQVKEFQQTTVSELLQAVKTQDNIMRLLDRCLPYLESSDLSLLLIYGNDKETTNYLNQRDVHFTEPLPTSNLSVSVCVNKTHVRVTIHKQKEVK